MISTLFDLTHKKAIVTGGSVGIGRACATALASAGADVAIVGRTEKTAERTCDSLRKLGVDAFFVKCDVTDYDQIREMTAEVVRRFGRIDIAINNAGGSPSGSAFTLSKDAWDRAIGLNLSAVFWCAQAQARQMAGQGLEGGKIINIASMYATVAGGNSAYNAAKAGVTHLTRSLAAEWGPHNINVNCISPGWMLTPGNRDAITPRLRERMREVTPLGSLLRYEDLYGAVIFLASSASDCVTGLDLIVDGGHTVNTWLLPVVRQVPSRTNVDDEEINMMRDLSPP